MVVCVRPSILLITLFALLGPYASWHTSEQALTLSQVEQLISVAPDAAIAGEITSRGVSFVVNDELLSKLLALGAGPDTISVLKALRPQGSVVAVSDAGATIYLDGTNVGVADGKGELHFPALAGAHIVKSVKAQRRDHEKQIAVSADQATRVELPLEWSVGFLKLTSNRPSASVEIPGVGRYSGSHMNLELPPGKYQVIANGFRLATWREEVVVIAGQTTERAIYLVVDSGFRNSTLESAAAYLRGRRWDDAAKEANSLLEINPPDGRARAVLAMAALGRHRVIEFESEARRSLATGGTIELEVKHHHAREDLVHPARIALSASGFGFVPTVDEKRILRCGFKPFLIPIARVTDARMTSEDENGMLEIFVLSKPDSKKGDSLKFGGNNSYSRDVDFSRPLLGGTLSGTKSVLRSSTDQRLALAAMSRLIRDAISRRFVSR